MSPVAHTGLAVLGWQAGSAPRTWKALGLFVLVSNLADVDFLLTFLFGPRPVFVHQAYTHNLVFVLVLSGLLALALPRGRGRLALISTGLSHLAADFIVIDTLPPVGFRLLFPFSEALFNVGLFPYLVRPPYGAVLSARNAVALSLEAAVFVLPVVAIYARRLRRDLRAKEFWMA
jgi:membrane-bound metal-dependent hydrolase YbcI (DUF457 family)